MHSSLLNSYPIFLKKSKRTKHFLVNSRVQKRVIDFDIFVCGILERNTELKLNKKKQKIERSQKITQKISTRTAKAARRTFKPIFFCCCRFFRILIDFQNRFKRYFSQLNPKILTKLKADKEKN